MREGKPSFTAAAVAAARGIARVDPLAMALVDGPLSFVMRVGRVGRGPAAAINLATLGLVDHIEMRTLAIDATLREAIEAGVRQLVVLGARARRPRVAHGGAGRGARLRGGPPFDA